MYPQRVAGAVPTVRLAPKHLTAAAPDETWCHTGMECARHFFTLYPFHPFSFLLILNSQGSGLDVPDADLETDGFGATAKCTEPRANARKCMRHALWHSQRYS